MKRKKMMLMLAVAVLALTLFTVGCASADKDLNENTEGGTDTRAENTTVAESETESDKENDTQTESTTAAVVAEPSPEILLDIETLEIAVSTAGWIDEDAFYAAALNSHRMAESGHWFQPIFKFDTYEDLTKFKSASYPINGMDHSYNEVPSFNSVTAKYDATFFEENTLMLVYVGSGSGSYRFGVNSIACDGSSFVVYVERLNNPELRTADMAGWFITVAVPDRLVGECTMFDANLKK